MAILCEFWNVIVPISKINEIYIGGFEKFKSERIDRFGQVLYHDKYLFHQGAMDSDFLNFIVSSWEKLGLVSKEEKNGKVYWKDLCVVDTFDGPTLPCEWIEFKFSTQPVVFMKGTEPGEIAGPVRKGFKASIT